MVEIKEEKQIYHCLNMVYINYLVSSPCTFIYLRLKIPKLLRTNYKPGQWSIQGTQISECELISKG